MFDTREKKERALGTKLLLKPQRCTSPKCAMTRRPHRPGEHGHGFRRRPSEFGQQLSEKQKIRVSYGLRDKQLFNLFKKALKTPEATGEMLMGFLERRLDNVVYRLGIAPSRSVGRQLVGHGHITVNGRKTTAPSYQVKVNDVIGIRPESQHHPLFKDLAEKLAKYDAPVWLRVDEVKLEGQVISLPKDFEVPFDVNLVVDYYSK